MSETEGEMYCRQDSYGRKLVTQTFMNLGYFNFGISVLPVV